MVDFDGDRDFIGKTALLGLRDSTDGPSRRFVGLRLDNEETFRASVASGRVDEVLSRVYWGSTPVHRDDNTIGRASSLCWSPTLGGPIAFGFLDTGAVSVGDEVGVDLCSIDGAPVGRVSARVVETPFIEMRRSKK